MMCCVKYLTYIFVINLVVKKNQYQAFFQDQIQIRLLELCKSSHRRCSIEKVILKNFAKFTGIHRCFPVNFAKFLRTIFYRTHLDDCFRLCTIEKLKPTRKGSIGDEDWRKLILNKMRNFQIISSKEKMKKTVFDFSFDSIGKTTI